MWCSHSKAPCLCWDLKGDILSVLMLVNHVHFCQNTIYLEGAEMTFCCFSFRIIKLQTVSAIDIDTMSEITPLNPKSASPLCFQYVDYQWWEAKKNKVKSKVPLKYVSSFWQTNHFLWFFGVINSHRSYVKKINPKYISIWFFFIFLYFKEHRNLKDFLSVCYFALSASAWENVLWRLAYQVV